MEDESNVWDAAPCRTEPQSARKIWPWAPASAPVGPGCAYAESRRATMLTRLSSSNRGAVVRLPARLGSEPLATNKQLAGPLPGDTKTHERRVHARMLTPADWASASRYLGLPERFKHNALHATLARLTGHGSLTKLLNDQAHRERPRSVGWAPRLRAAPSAPGNLARHRREHLALPSPQPTNSLRPRPQPHPTPRTHSPHRDYPDRRANASVWLWCELTSGHELAAPIKLPGTLYKHREFKERHLNGLRERLLVMGQILLDTPTAARSTIRTQLAAEITGS